MTMPKTAVGFAHGKIILMGEHSVVYGEPALAMPFPAATVQSTVTETNGPVTIDCLFYSGFLEDAPEHLKNIRCAVEAACLAADLPLENFNLTIISTIPAERGMGSSAAVAAAVIRSLYHYAGKELKDEQLLRLINVAEVIAHGNPSGLDALMTSSASPVYFKKQHPFEPFPLSLEGYLIVADTGQMGQTKEAVGDIAAQMNKQEAEISPKIKQLGQLADSAKESIQENELEKLGSLMTEAHRILSELTVSNDKLDTLVEKALETGALGAKLTGGGRGGCMISLASSSKEAERISNALLKAGAVQTWIHPLGGTRHDG